MKKWLGYGVLAGLLVTYAVLWFITKDAVGAFVSLMALAVVAAFVGAIAAYVFQNVPSRDAGEREVYETRRALSVEDLNTGCLLYVIEIADGRLLCLYGQHYYEFEPIDDDPQVNQSRTFPTKTFSLLRHKKNQEVLKVSPGLGVVEPT